MEIVAAGVHDRDIVAGVIMGMHFAGVWKASLLLDRESIEFGSQHDGWTGAVLQQRNDPGAADVLGNFVSERAQPGRQFCCSLRFMSRQFGMLVQIEIK